MQTHRILIGKAGGIPEGYRVRLVLDEEYQSKGSWALDTEEETAEAVAEEESRLQRGEFLALGAIVEKRCCTCGGWNQSDSVWGIVVKNTDEYVAKIPEWVGLEFN